MSSEWVEEMELSSKEIQICTPSSTIQCSIGKTSVDVLYNPTVGANLMSTSFVHTYFSDDAITSTIKTCRIASHFRLEGLGVLHNISLYRSDNEVPLDFHVFDIQNFDILIGHPLEKLFFDLPKIGDLDVKLGRDTFSIPITRAKNLVAESLPYFNVPKEVMSFYPLILLSHP